MKVDKKNGLCCFNDDAHVYWNEKTNEKYISVTTLIGKFENPYDSEFWSKYKAFERLVSPEVFKFEKGGLLQSKRWNNKLLETYDLDEVTFNGTQQDILDEWAKTNKESCERGTKIHAEMENKYYAKPKHTFKNVFGINGEFVCKKNNMDLNVEKGIFPEYLVYRESEDGILKLAGQIDLLVKDGNDIYIIDYKTNKELKFKSYFDTGSRKNIMMGYPINNIQDCNFMHYTLQLSTYAWMIQKINPNFNIKKLIIIHYDHDGNVKHYELDYLKDDVQRMLAYYKNQCIADARKESRKKIQF